MNLTYRGIRYQPARNVITQPDQVQISPNKHCTDNAEDMNKVILIRPINYYTYRGVSYTKNLVYDNQTKNLLDIDRQ